MPNTLRSQNQQDWPANWLWGVRSEERCNDDFVVSILSNWTGNSSTGIKQGKQKAPTGPLSTKNPGTNRFCYPSDQIEALFTSGFSLGYQWTLVSEMYFVGHYHTHQKSILLGKRLIG